MKKIIALGLAAGGVLWSLSQRRNKTTSNDTWAAGTDPVA